MEEIIKIKDLTFKWKGQTENLLDISDFKVQKGEHLLLQGASGSGKSSLLSLLGGLHLAQQGSINILNIPMEKLKSNQRDEFRGQHIGFIFQLFNLVPYLSVLNNVTLPCNFSKKRSEKILKSGSTPGREAQRLLNEVGLSGPGVLNKPVTELSVGQQQRVAACRALIGNPEIIIADEPTSSLDEEAEKAFIDLLSNECKQNETTLIFVSHNTRFKHLFDRALVLKDGALLEEPVSKSGGML